MEPVRMLWTGGWDSSFRFLQVALLEGRPVQPIYLVNVERESTLFELRAMERIRSGVLERVADPSLIAPTQLLVRTQFEPTEELTRAFKSIKAQVRVGSQYLYLAAVAEAQGWKGVELSVERYPHGPSDLQKLLFRADGTLKDVPEAALFRYWSFPVIHLTKEDMGTIAGENGFLDLLSESWFCHTPVGGRPCGVCRPCQLAYSSQLRYANPAVARSVLLYRRARKAGARRIATRLIDKVT